MDTTQIHVGDHLRLQVVVDHPPGSSIAWPDSVDLSPFEVVDVRIDPSTQVEDGVRTVGTFTLTSFELGELDLPSLPLVVRDSTGSEVQLSSDPFRIGVVSVGVDESGDIRDIKGPLELARDWGRLLLWALLALVVLMALRWLWGRRSARDDEEVPAAPPQPSRPFHELAYEALDALEQSTLLEQGRVKEFHIRLSEIIRSYVEGQLRVPAMELTTGEVVAGLREAALGEGICEAFNAFLDRCDLVKFAKYRPSSEGSLELLADARNLVGRTSGLAGREVAPDPVEAGALAGGAPT
ncbi:MAG: hypothetical protein HKO53_17930 [Gemmatimonadetes bacterium]|nr:hypothetical protein [Gemmatimonadota bacterium]